MGHNGVRLADNQALLYFVFRLPNLTALRCIYQPVFCDMTSAIWHHVVVMASNSSSAAARKSQVAVAIALQCDCDCDLRLARCCAAAVRSHNTVPRLKIEVCYSAHSQLAFDASLLFTDCSAIATATCDLRAAALLLFEAITW